MISKNLNSLISPRNLQKSMKLKKTIYYMTKLEKWIKNKKETNSIFQKLFKEHLIQNFEYLNYIQIKNMDKNLGNIKKVFLKKKSKRKIN